MKQNNTLSTSLWSTMLHAVLMFYILSHWILLKTRAQSDDTMRGASQSEIGWVLTRTRVWDPRPLSILPSGLICPNIPYTEFLWRKMDEESHLKISQSTKRILIQKWILEDNTGEVLVLESKGTGFRIRQILIKFPVPSVRWTVWIEEN